MDPNLSKSSSLVNPELSSDEAIDKVGGCLRFQIIALFVTMFTFSSASMISYGLPFLENKSEIKITCTYRNGTSHYCNSDEACYDPEVKSYEYSTNPSKGLVNWVVDFKLACHSGGDFSNLSSVYFAGYCLSCVIFLPLSDCVGRKPVIIAGLLLHLVANTLIFTVGSWPFLFVYNGIIGMRSPMACQTVFLLLIQLTGAKWRSLFTAIVNSTDGSYYLWIALAYKYIGDWKPWFYANTALVVVCLIFLVFFYPESPRFYTVHKKFDKARVQYNRVAIMNNKPQISDRLEGEVIQTRASKVHICDLWRGQRARDRALLFIMPFFWFVADVISFGLAFSINDLEGDVYFYGIILGSACLVVAASMGFIAEWIGRKPSFALVFALNAVGSICFQFFSYTDFLRYFFIFVAKLGANGSFAMCYMMTSEVFPTRYRGLMFGISNMAARMGGILAPQFSTNISPHYFILIFAGLSVVSFALTIFLKETKGLKMPDLVQKSGKLQTWDERLLNEKE